MIWCILPNLKGSTTSASGSSLRYLLLIPYFQRLTIAYPLSIQIAKATGIVVQKAWLGAAYNLLLYMLSSHVSTYFITTCTTITEPISNPLSLGVRMYVRAGEDWRHRPNLRLLETDHTNTKDKKQPFSSS